MLGIKGKDTKSEREKYYKLVVIRRLEAGFR